MLGRATATAAATATATVGFQRGLHHHLPPPPPSGRLRHLDFKALDPHHRLILPLQLAAMSEPRATRATPHRRPPTLSACECWPSLPHSDVDFASSLFVMNVPFRGPLLPPSDRHRLGLSTHHPSLSARSASTVAHCLHIPPSRCVPSRCVTPRPVPCRAPPDTHVSTLLHHHKYLQQQQQHPAQRP